MRYLYFILWPFAVLHLKYVQAMYKKHTTKSSDHGLYSNRNLSRLILLQSIEEYYVGCFGCWGIFHPSCISSPRHQKRLHKMFPGKNFKEIPMVKQRSDEMITFYRNCLYINDVPQPDFEQVNGPATFDFANFDYDAGKYKIKYRGIRTTQNKRR